MRLLGSLILLGTIAVSACAHDFGAPAPASAPAPAHDFPVPVPISASEVTVENLLRWPLEGLGGIDKVKAGLHQVMQMEPLRAQQFTGSGSVPLADGNVLTFAWIKNLSNSFSISLAQEPCVSPEYAKELIGALQSPYFYDMHGVDHGKTYSTKRNGVWVEFMTAPKTYRCVSSIHINLAKESSQ